MYNGRRKIARKTAGGPRPAPVTQGHSIKGFFLSEEEEETVKEMSGLTDYPKIYKELEPMWEFQGFIAEHPAVDFARLKTGHGLYEGDLVFNKEATNPWNMSNNLTPEERFTGSKQLYDAAKTESACLGRALAREYDLRMDTEKRYYELQGEEVKKDEEYMKVLGAAMDVVDNTVGEYAGRSSVYQVCRYKMQKPGEPWDPKAREFLKKTIWADEKADVREEEAEAEDKDFLMSYPQFGEGAKVPEGEAVDCPVPEVILKNVEHYSVCVDDPARVVALNQCAGHFVRAVDALIPEELTQSRLQCTCYGLLGHYLSGRPGLYNGLDETRFEGPPSKKQRPGEEEG